MTLIQRLKQTLGGNDAGSAADALACLIVAAREDPAFRKRVLLVLQLPANQRESMVRSAVAEMKLRGESGALQAAFTALSSAEGADLAARLIGWE